MHRRYYVDLERSLCDHVCHVQPVWQLFIDLAPSSPQGDDWARIHRRVQNEFRNALAHLTWAFERGDLTDPRQLRRLNGHVERAFLDMAKACALLLLPGRRGFPHRTALRLITPLQAASVSNCPDRAERWLEALRTILQPMDLNLGPDTCAFFRTSAKDLARRLKHARASAQQAYRIDPALRHRHAFTLRLERLRLAFQLEARFVAITRLPAPGALDRYAAVYSHLLPTLITGPDQRSLAAIDRLVAHHVRLLAVTCVNDLSGGNPISQAPKTRRLLKACIQQPRSAHAAELLGICDQMYRIRIPSQQPTSPAPTTAWAWMADIVGFSGESAKVQSTLSQALISAFYKVCESEPGNRAIATNTWGDAVMAVHRCPEDAVAHLRATYEAYRQQTGTDRHDLSAGLHHGPTIIHSHPAYGIDVAGEAITMAARMEGVAHGGEIALWNKSRHRLPNETVRPTTRTLKKGFSLGAKHFHDGAEVEILVIPLKT